MEPECERLLYFPVVGVCALAMHSDFYPIVLGSKVSTYAHRHLLRDQIGAGSS